MTHLTVRKAVPVVTRAIAAVREVPPKANTAAKATACRQPQPTHLYSLSCFSDHNPRSDPAFRFALANCLELCSAHTHYSVSDRLLDVGYVGFRPLNDQVTASRFAVNAFLAGSPIGWPVLVPESRNPLEPVRQAMTDAVSLLGSTHLSRSRFRTGGRKNNAHDRHIARQIKAHVTYERHTDATR